MRELQDRALARAVVARYLKLGLRSPDPSTYDELAAPFNTQALTRAALALGIDELPAPGTPSLPDLTSAYVRLFGHSLRGRVCPYEIEYGKREPLLQAHELSDVSGFYRAFGLEPSEGLVERWDHVAVELEFVELLSLKEAWALDSGQEEMFELTRHALKRFVREHLGFFGIALGASLSEEDPEGFYGRRGRLLESYLVALGEELDVPLGPRTLPLSSVEDDGAPMACGAGGACGDGAVSPGEPAFDV